MPSHPGTEILIAELKLELRECVCKLGVLCRRCRAEMGAVVRLQEMTNEIDGLRSFKRSVDEALNSGTGTYKP